MSRTTVASFLQFLVVGARMDYHFEHHLFPTLPYYRLRELHRDLHRAGFFESALPGSRYGYRTEDYLLAYARLATTTAE
jgi:fatty acid desaturase